MKTRHLFVATTALALLAAGQMTFAQAPAPAPAAPTTAPAANPNHGPVMTALRAQWASVRDKVIAICDIVPEDKLGYKATPEVRSFEELIEHITGEGYTFLRSVGSVPGVTPPTNQEIAALTGKVALMKALRDSFEWQGKVIDSLTEAQATEMVAGRGGAMSPRWNGIVSLLVDNMDHYGNLVTYVRINGMIPPASAGRAGRGGGQGGGAGRGGPGGAAPGGGMAPPARGP